MKIEIESDMLNPNRFMEKLFGHLQNCGNIKSVYFVYRVLSMKRVSGEFEKRTLVDDGKSGSSSFIVAKHWYQ